MERKKHSDKGPWNRQRGGNGRGHFTVNWVFFEDMGAKQVALHEENPAQRSMLFLHISKANAAPFN